MPLASQQPEPCELPDLLLVGTCSFADFFASDQWSLLGETWDRFIKFHEEIDSRANPERMFGLELYPPDFPKDRRWYYIACAEVTSLDRPFPTCMVSRFIPASNYLKFTVSGPVTELAPAFRYIYDEWLPKSKIKLAASYDLELYDSRFVGPCSEDSVVDLLIPVAD